MRTVALALAQAKDWQISEIISPGRDAERALK